MAYTIEEYNTLKSAIAQGAVRVKYADKEVEYRSLGDMKAILRDMENELFPKNRNNGRTYASFTKGIC
jgi:hypothetical protein